MTLRQRSLVLLVTVLATACSAAATLPSPQPRVPATIAPVGDMPASPSPTPPAAAPAWQGSIHRIGPTLRPKIVGRSWHPGCPVPLRDLRAVEVSYWNFEGTVRKGPLIVHERVASDVLWVFHRLFRARFPIKRIVLPPKWHPPRPSDYWDPKPTSPSAAFNCRPATDSTTLSQHAYGWAIDINPLQNPYVRSDGATLRAIAQPYRDRSLHRKGMIHDGDIVVRSFAAIGWEWGGHWHTLKDYMHFSLTGR